MKGMTTTARRAGVLTLALTLAGSAGAQQSVASGTSSAPWRAWFGCWSAAGVTPLGPDASAPVVCVTPTPSSDVARITTIAEGKVLSAQSVDASGRETPIEAKGCTGAQTGRWSADGRRVYLRAAATCDGVLRTTSGILAMTPAGEWLDVQGVTVAGTEQVRVVRYHDVGLHGTLPTEIIDALSNGAMAVSGARVAAGADIGTTGVAEASRATTLGVAEAFVLERGQRFALDARQLVALADAGVPSRITDAMIAVSNPQTFAVRRAAVAPRDTVYEDGSGRRVVVMLDRFNSPWGWGYSPYGYAGYGMGYSPYGYNPYGYNPYGYGSFGNGYPGYVYGGPVVIVKGGEAANPHGRMVKGHGYEAPGTATSGSADRESPRAYPRETRAPSDDSSSGSSSRGQQSSGASSSGSTERTAKPRP